MRGADLGFGGSSLALPFLRDAIGRAAHGVAGAALVLAAAWCCGRVLVGLVAPPDALPLERRVLEASLGAGALGSLLLVLAAVKAHTPVVVSALAGCLALGAGVLVWRDTDGAGSQPRPPNATRPDQWRAARWNAGHWMHAAHGRA